MNGPFHIEFLVFGLFIGSTFFGIRGATSTNATNSITVSPTYQKAVENEDVVIYCRDLFGQKVKWFRENYQPLPLNAKQKKSNLFIYGIRDSNTGTYLCSDSKNMKNFQRAHVEVLRRTTTIGYNLTRASTPFSTRGAVFSTTTPSTTPGVLGNSISRNETNELFECANGQTIKKSFVCNKKRDCDDGSDESKCEPWSPKITKLPKQKIEAFCGDQEADKSGTLVLECEAVGYPVPRIKWKKYEGHVPSKCQQFSKDGRGVLTCPEFQQTDQGAYSCVAENAKESSESQPKSVAKCSNVIHCRGFKVLSEDQIENCLNCYCSGKTNQCQGIASNLTVHKVSFSDEKVEVFADANGKVVFIPSAEEVAPDEKVRRSAQEITYCSLFGNNFQESSLLKSYGRNIKVPRFTRKAEFLPQAPDLIIRGNGVALMYTFNIISPSAKAVNVRFWPGNWHHLKGTGASREDLMTVLSNVDTALLRCEYKHGETLAMSKNEYVLLESSLISNFSNSVSYLEKCNCPLGYEGLSCESCASGYTKKARGDDFVCEKKYPKTCPIGWKGLNCDECDGSKGFFKIKGTCKKSTCDPDGSFDLIPGASGKCRCREGVAGDSCQKCDKGFFSLKKDRGCLKCWCSGATNQCNSSTLYKTAISRNPYGGYNSSDGRNFWLLPTDFNGNRLTSYGGYLNYTLKYKPNMAKRNAVLTVEFLSVDDVTLTYTHSYVDNSRVPNEESWVVPLREKNWKKSDMSPVTRGEFLTVLSKIKAIYIESPYHLSSGLANLTSTRLSSAASWGDDDGEIAVDVEQCNCPRGYTGLSCERCSEGYYKKKNGTITLCVKCTCSHCDPELGCLDCSPGTYRDNPMEEEKAVCKPCPCNANGKACVKDDYDQIICTCKPGFTGMYCEKRMPRHNESDFTVRIHPRRIKEKKVGAAIQLNCSYSSNEEMTISAKKIYRSGAESSVEDTYNNSVSVTADRQKSFSLTLDHELEFIKCSFHDAQGKEAGCATAVVEDLITLVKPVKITNCYSDRIEVKESESKELICEATGAPAPMINWYLTKKGTETIKVDTTEGVHSIDSAGLSENGTIYTCIAENSEGHRAVCTQVLIVLKKCDVVNIFPKEVRVEEGKNITLHCKSTVKGFLRWSRQSETLSGRFLPLGRSKEVNGILEITNASVSDTGTYVCKTHGKDGEINDTVSVTVTEKWILPTAVIQDDDKKLKVGDTYEVNCFVGGKPTPSVNWTKDSKPLASNVIVSSSRFPGISTLEIKKATLQNSGLYKCEARSNLGTASSFIFIRVEEKNVKPVVKIVPIGNTEPVEFSNISLECKASAGVPPPEIMWSKLAGEEWRTHASGSVLRFQRISRNDAGTYKCEGRNSAGRSEANVTIDVRIPPTVNVSEEHIAAREGEKISVTCLALGYPRPRITWAAHSGFGLQVLEKREDNLVLIEPLKSSAEQISLTASQTVDGQRVTCFAENSAGFANKTVTLKLLQEGGASSSETVERVPIGSYFELNCDFTAENVSLKKVGGLVGDECPIPNGLMIKSVQAQHNGTYICECESQSDTSCGKTINLIVVGFVPKFSKNSRSYLVVPTSLKSPESFRIAVAFNPAGENGVLLQKGNNDVDLYLWKKSPVLSLYDKDGFHFQVDTNASLELGHWYWWAVQITKQYVDMTIYDEHDDILRVTKYFDNFNFTPSVNDSFFVGGSTIKMRHSRKFRQLHISSFEGCISRLNIDHREVDIIKEASYSSNVTLCRKCSEEPNPCGSAGKCLDAPTQYGFMCVCPGRSESRDVACSSSCSGRGCETELDFCKLLNPCKRSDLHTCLNHMYRLQCDCAFGYSGTTCEKANDYSFCVKGNGYVRLPSSLLERDSLAAPEVIRMDFTLQDSKGVLLWQGNDTNYLAISVYNGRLMYVYFNQNLRLEISVPQAIHLNRKYRLEVKRSNNTAVLKLGNEHYKNATEFSTNRVSGDIYLGNRPKSETLSGLNGCIHYVAFGDKPKINLHEVEVERLNDFQPSREDPEAGEDYDPTDAEYDDENQLHYSEK